MHIGRITALLAAIVLVVAACGDDTGVESDRAWSRGGLEGQNSAVYLDLKSADGDTLLGVSIDSSVAAEAQIHETVASDMSDDMGGTDEEMSDDEMGYMGSGADVGMTMRRITELALPAGTTVSFEPGGYHIMLLDLAESIEIGSDFQITLRLANAGEVTVDVEVREEAP